VSRTLRLLLVAAIAIGTPLPAQESAQPPAQDTLSGPPSVRFAAGNQAFDEGDDARAIWHFLCVLERQPGHAPTLANLRLAAARLGAAPVEPPQTGVLPGIRAMPGALLLALVAGLQTLGVLGLYFRRGPRLLWVGLCGLGLGLAVVRAKAQWWSDPAAAVVLSERLALREAPSASAPLVLALKAGETVAIEEVAGDWTRVRLDSDRGWVARAGLGFVE